MYKFSKKIKRKVIKIEAGFWQAYSEFKERYYKRYGNDDCYKLNLEFRCDLDAWNTSGYYHGSEWDVFANYLDRVDKRHGFAINVENSEFGYELIRFNIQHGNLTYNSKPVKDYKSRDDFTQHFNDVIDMLDLRS